MNAVQKERLLKLAAFLENVPKKLFDLDIVVRGNGSELKSFYQNGKECGSAGCAVGHLPCIFPRSFKYVVDAYEDYDDNGRPFTAYDTEVESKEGDDVFTAAKEFFGLDSIECDFLFMPTAYPDDRKGPKSVAKRIRSFANRTEAAKKMLEKGLEEISRDENGRYLDPEEIHKRWGLS